MRWLQVTDLMSVRDAELPNPWPRPCDQILNTVLVTVEYGDRGPEDFRRADVWPGVIFGKTGTADFRDISQGWLRDITQAWCWDNLNRSNNFHMFGNILNEIDYFSEYLRANAPCGGADIAALDRSTITGFAAYLPPSSNRAPNDIGRDAITNMPCRGADPCNTNASCRCNASFATAEKPAASSNSRDHSCSPTICSSRG